MDWVRLWGNTGFVTMWVAILWLILTRNDPPLFALLLWAVGIASVFGASCVLIGHLIYLRWFKE